MSDVENKSYLFEGLEEAYLNDRKKHDEANKPERNQALYDRIRSMISKASNNSSDNISSQGGAIVNGDSITLTAASLFDTELKIGETRVVKSTQWIPSGQREVQGNTVDFSLKFSSVDYLNLSENSTRPGNVYIEGRLSDSEGVETSFPLALLQKDPDTQSIQILYGFGSEIPFGSQDEQEIIDLINDAGNNPEATAINFN